jgi:16S rRNA U1498 N3-methylase RsmE
MKVYDLSCDYFITAWNSDDCKYNKYKKKHSHIEKWQRNILDILRMIKQASRLIVPLVQNELLYNFSFYFTA